MYKYLKHDLSQNILNDGESFCLIFNTYMIPNAPIIKRLYSLFPNLRMRIEREYKDNSEINSPIRIEAHSDDMSADIILLRTTPEISHHNLAKSLIAVERYLRAAFETRPIVGEFVLGNLKPHQRVMLEDVLLTSLLDWRVQDYTLTLPPMHTKRKMAIIDFDFED